jgi:hypothetical protein
VGIVYKTMDGDMRGNGHGQGEVRSDGHGFVRGNDDEDDGIYYIEDYEDVTKGDRIIKCFKKLIKYADSNNLSFFVINHRAQRDFMKLSS